MIIKEMEFKTIEEFIEKLKENESIVGILEYGGRTFKDMSLGGDYDLTIIFEEKISANINGVHLHINGIPVDCMILSKEDFLSETPGDVFLLAHLDCNILYDKDGTTNKLVEDIKIKWNTYDELSDFENMLFRFTFRHVVDKLEHRLFDDVIYSKYFMTSSMEWFLSCYARLNKLQVGKPKVHFKHIKENEPKLYKIIEDFYLENSLERQFSLFEECAKYILRPIGGLWQDNEILFHLRGDGVRDYKEQERILKLLFD